jgi:hypothetical protein
MTEPESPGLRILRLIREDPRTASARQRLDAKLAELVPDEDAQLDLREFITIEFETDVMQVCLNAFTKVFLEDA